MRYQVPQFIDSETKVIGPFTIRQFMYIAIGFIVIIVIGYSFAATTSILISIPIAAIAIALAFLKIDGIPFPKYILMATYFVVAPKRYTFKQGEQINEYIDQDIFKNNDKS